MIFFCPRMPISTSHRLSAIRNGQLTFPFIGFAQPLKLTVIILSTLFSFVKFFEPKKAKMIHPVILYTESIRAAWNFCGNGSAGSFVDPAGDIQ